VSTRASAFTIAILLLATFPASAAVYQCKSADGSVSFSDTPCPEEDSGQKLNKFSRVIVKKVSASVSHLGTTLGYVDGYAYWAKPNRELTAVLYTRALSEDELARVAAGERLNTYDEESTGQVTLLFDDPRPRRGTLRHLRSVFTGFSPDNPKSPWTSNHGKDELADVLPKFDLGEDDAGNTWLEFGSRANDENIRWEIDFSLVVEP